MNKKLNWIVVMVLLVPLFLAGCATEKGAVITQHEPKPFMRIYVPWHISYSHQSNYTLEPNAALIFSDMAQWPERKCIYIHSLGKKGKNWSWECATNSPYGQGCMEEEEWHGGDKIQYFYWVNQYGKTMMALTATDAKNTIKLYSGWYSVPASECGFSSN